MAESVTLSAAQAVVEAARAKAEEIGVPMNIAVVDEGNNLTAFARMDGAWLGSIDIAQNKAYTARALRHVDQGPGAAGAAQPAAVRHRGLEPGPADRVRRRHPAEAGDQVVGAIGVSGGSVEQDHEVAEAGVAAF